MKKSAAAVLIVGLAGCVSPSDPAGAAPDPSNQEIHQPQSRTLPIRSETVFPAVLGVLMNGGYLIQSADRELGLVTFSRQLPNPNHDNSVIEEEGSAVFSAAGQDRTQVTVRMTGKWWWSIDMVGTHGTTWSAVRYYAADYANFFDLLEKGLSQPKR